MLRYGTVRYGTARHGTARHGMCYMHRHKQSGREKSVWDTGKIKIQNINLRNVYFVGLYCTGRFIIFCLITNIYDKKPEGPTLMELFTATGKLKKCFFRQLEMLDVRTTVDTAHIDTIFKFSSC